MLIYRGGGGWRSSLRSFLVAGTPDDVPLDERGEDGDGDEDASQDIVTAHVEGDADAQGDEDCG